MDLYPTTVLDAATAASDNNTIPSGNLIVIPIDMTVTQMTQITLRQISLTQDYSLRMWLSVYPHGMTVEPGMFPVLRFGGVPFVIYVAPQTPPSDTYPIFVLPGVYMMNILNLNNETNMFTFSQTILA